MRNSWEGGDTTPYRQNFEFSLIAQHDYRRSGRLGPAIVLAGRPALLSTLYSQPVRPSQLWVCSQNSC